MEEPQILSSGKKSNNEDHDLYQEENSIVAMEEEIENERMKVKSDIDNKYFSS